MLAAEALVVGIVRLPLDAEVVVKPGSAAHEG